VMKQKDKKTVHMVSTVHSKDMEIMRAKGREEKFKSVVSVEYSNGISKYYMKMFQHVTEVFNSFVLHRNLEGRETSVFQMNLMETCVKKYQISAHTPSRLDTSQTEISLRTNA